MTDDRLADALEDLAERTRPIIARFDEAWNEADRDRATAALIEAASGLAEAARRVARHAADYRAVRLDAEALAEHLDAMAHPDWTDRGRVAAVLSYARLMQAGAEDLRKQLDSR